MWAQAVVTVLGIWLLAAPDVLNYSGPARLNNQIIGAWIATFGLIAMSESVRAVRWVNVGLGLWLVIAPSPGNILISSSGRASLSVLRSWRWHARGHISERFGGGWTALWRPAE